MGTTTTYGLEYPDVDADEDTWGAIETAYKNALEAKIAQIGDYFPMEVLESAPVSLTTSVPANVAWLDLGVGSWAVEGNAGFVSTGATPTILMGWFSQTSATQPARPGAGGMFYLNANLINSGVNLFCLARRFELVSPARIYLSVNTSFPSGTLGGYGFIGATRVKPAP